MWRAILTATLTVLVLAPAAALAEDKPAAATDNATIELWNKHCAKCHAKDGTGQTKVGQKLKVKDYTKADVQAKLKDEEMLKAVKEGAGKPDEEGEKPMPAFGEKIPDTDITKLIGYIRGFKK